MKDSNEKLNNWNPWINSNLLTVILLIEKDRERKISLLMKVIRSLDFYLEEYPEDGCCDEGPGYWTRAGASAFECLETLSSITGDAINVFNQKKIKEMGRYILRAHIDGEYVTNYADAPARIKMETALIYRYGKKTGDRQLMNFASHTLSLYDSIREVGPYGLKRALSHLLLHHEISKNSPQYVPCLEHYFKDVQVFIKRGASLYLTAKGGHNQENHNHNDIGSFMIYKNGLPLLIDAGNMTYTRQTFSEERYDIWVNQSLYHNSITVNGIMQHHGPHYKATKVNYARSEKASTFSLNMEKAYPNPDLLHLRRHFIFDNDTQDIVISDELQLRRKSDDILYTLMTCNAPTVKEQEVIFSYDKEKIALTFNQQVDYVIEKIEITDTILNNTWGASLYRVKATLAESFISGVITLTFKNI